MLFLELGDVEKHLIGFKHVNIVCLIWIFLHPVRLNVQHLVVAKVILRTTNKKAFKNSPYITASLSA